MLQPLATIYTFLMFSGMVERGCAPDIKMKLELIIGFYNRRWSKRHHFSYMAGM